MFSKSRFWIAFLAILLCSPHFVQAQPFTKAQLNSRIGVQFPDNNAGAIPPSILRGVTSDIVNSIMPTAPVTAGNLACFNGTTGLLQDCNNTINGGTITGASVTGLPGPVNSTDAATKGYVDATSAGLTVLAPSALATAAVLPNSPTYSNGTLGVGATLTAGSNTTLTVDGTVAALNAVVLVKNQAAPEQNGIYTVTTAGSGSAAWVLTRATYFDEAAEMLKGSYTFVTGGTTNINTAWTLAATTTTVGTTAVNFNQFSQVTVPTVQCTQANSAGFVGNGSTDNAPAFNTWFSNLSGASGCLEFGVGKYAFNSAVTYTMSTGRQSIQIRGLGAEASILYWSGGGGLKIINTNTLDAVVVHDIAFVTGAAGTGTGLYLATTGGGWALSTLSSIYNVMFRGDDWTGNTSNADYWLVGLRINNWLNVNIYNIFSAGLLQAPGGTGGGTGFEFGCTSPNICAVMNITNSFFFYQNVSIQLDDYWEGVTVAYCQLNGEVGSAGLYVAPGGTHTGPLLNIIGNQLNVAGTQVDITSQTNQIVMQGNTVAVWNGIGAALGTGLNPIVTGNLFDVASGASTIGLSINGVNAVVGSNLFVSTTTGVALGASSTRANVSQNVYDPSVTTKVSNAGTANSVGVATP